MQIFVEKNYVSLCTLTYLYGIPNVSLDFILSCVEYVIAGIFDS
jgi:hypothetical protein